MTPRLRLLAATALLGLGPTAWADPCQGRTEASCRAPGLVEPPRITSNRSSLGAAEGQKLGQRLVKLLEVVQQAPPFREPRGMSLHPTVSVESAPAHTVKHHPVIARAHLLALPIKLEDKRSVRDKKTGAWRGTGEGPQLRLTFNDLGVFLSSQPLDFSDSGQYFPEPQQVGEVRGFPVYRVDGKEVLLLRKRDALPWRPFPVERYLKSLISQEQATLARFQKQLPMNAERQARIAALQEELGKLTPAQRQGGVCMNARRKRGDLTGLDLGCGKDSQRLVEVHQDFFSPSAPRSSLQVLAISTTWGVLPKDDRVPNPLGRVVRSALQEVDLQALQAMLD